MRKLAYTLLIVAILLCGLIFIGNAPISKAQNGTNVSGTITQDTTWTRSNGPYNFTGDVTVAKGVTLTIEPGTIVSVNSGFTLKVDGALHAVGAAEEPIIFGSMISGTNVMGTISFTQSSTSWNEASGSGSIIQYALLRNDFYIHITDCSPKLGEDTIQGGLVTITTASPLISQCIFDTTGDDLSGSTFSIYGGSAIIANNSMILGQQIFSFCSYYFRSRQRNIFRQPYQR